MTYRKQGFLNEIKGWQKVVFGGLFITLVIVNAILNRLVQKEVDRNPLVSDSPAAGHGSLLSQELSRKEDSSDDRISDTGEFIRRSRVERGSDYIENIFYKGDREIARQKVYGSGKVEQSGRIPDGKIKFYDEYTGASGEEFYLDGKKSGISKAYHTNGRLKSVQTYLNNKLQTQKEYHVNGNLMFEVDYRDARLDMKDEKENGIGRLYYPDGVLKYEWYFTNSGKAYRKSYNPDGTLRVEFYYDRFGKLIEDDNRRR